MAEAALRKVAPLHSPVSGLIPFGQSRRPSPVPVETEVVEEEELVMDELPDPEVLLDDELEDETSEVWVVTTGPLAEVPGVQFGFVFLTPFSIMVQSLVLKT